MDIHKPKPWHGLREFLKEYLIIVVGVLTALSAEAGVEWLHWRHQVELAHEALAFDMKRVMAWSATQDAQSPCIGARLLEIEQILDVAQASGRLPPMGELPTPGRGGWVMRSWSTLTYGQTLAHMSHREQLSLAALALQIDNLHQLGPEFSEHWSALKALTGPGRRIDAAEIATLRDRFLSARRVEAGLRQGATRAETFVIQSGLLSSSEWRQAWRQGVPEASDPLNLALCSPIPTTFTGRGSDWASRTLARPMTEPGTATMDDRGIRDESLR